MHEGPFSSLIPDIVLRVEMVNSDTMAGAKRARPESSTQEPAACSEDSQPRPTFDRDILDCNICTEPLAPPIFQCANGHVLCSKCCRKLHNACPSCSRPTGTIRNLALEKLIESLCINCKFWAHGCVHLLKFTDKQLHETQCAYAPIKCPINLCEFSGPENSYLEHFQSKHEMAPKNFTFGQRFSLVVKLDGDKTVLLKAGDRLFMFHSEKTDLGYLYYATQFGVLSPHQNRPFGYKLEISDLLSTSTYFMERSSMYYMESFCLPTQATRVESFLLVPDTMLDAHVVLVFDEP